MELEREYIQDVIFGIAFLLIAIFAAYRTSIYWDWFGSGKIVTLFYLLISMTSISRTIWFFVPSDFLEGGYVPVGVIKFHSSYGFGYFISEICRIFGSLCLYTVFILLICYWSYTLQQTEISVNKLSKLKQDNKYSCINHLDTFQVVCIIAMSIFIIEAVNIFLFVFEISNLQQMLIIDASILSIISFCSLLSLLYYSYRIQVIMKLVSSTEVNPSVVAISKIQVLRIHSITFFTAVFFIGRMLLDLLFIVLALRELNRKYSIFEILYLKFSLKFFCRFDRALLEYLCNN